MITFEQAGFDYGDGQILSDLSFELAPGSFHFLTGPSGSGKTTLLKLCYLALKPTRGAVHVFGEDSRTADADQVAHLRRRIGVVHQDCRFLDHLSIADNIALPLEVSGRMSAHNLGNRDALLDWVALDHRAKALPPELSGGERQRAALARAVILSPDILLADEPTGNVDSEMGERLMRLLIELNQMGRTILVATHDMALIRQVKEDVRARVLRLVGGHMQVAGAEL